MNTRTLLVVIALATPLISLGSGHTEVLLATIIQPACNCEPDYVDPGRAEIMIPLGRSFTGDCANGFCATTLEGLSQAVRLVELHPGDCYVMQLAYISYYADIKVPCDDDDDCPDNYSVPVEYWSWLQASIQPCYEPDPGAPPEG